MRWVDGPTLLAIRGETSLEQKVRLIAQVAEGLGRAHASGIVHRDLKPDNIMITRDGYAKIVDFGVAKLTERTGPRAGHTGITTPTSRIGTTAYMSPEQVEGKPVDHRADVFSFGTVLYELITGTNPFASPVYADTLHNIVHLDPELEKVPAKYRRIVRRCLRKEPEDRYQSMKDVALDLREALGENEAQSGRKTRPLSIAAVLLLIAATAAVAWYVALNRDVPATEPAPAMLMSRLTSSGQVASAAISPDGRYLAYAERVGHLQALNDKQIATGTTTTIQEPGGPVTFSVTITNTSLDVMVTIDNVVDELLYRNYLRFTTIDDNPERSAVASLVASHGTASAQCRCGPRSHSGPRRTAAQASLPRPRKNRAPCWT